MDIEKLFNHLSTNKKLLIYLFEHRDRVIDTDEIEELVSPAMLENLTFHEIVEVIEQKISLDYRVITFLKSI